MENKKMTKKENFNELMNIVTTLDIDENKKDNLLSFIEHEIELLDKKNSRKSDKPTKKQIANHETSLALVDEMEESKYYTSKELGELMGVSFQKIVALVKEPLENGAIAKTSLKGKTLYFKGEEPKGE
jgi:Fic family protein